MDAFELAKQSFLGGIQSLQRSNLLAAESQFESSLKFLPGRVSTLNNLAAVKLKLRKFTEAEEFARQATTTEDNSPEAWANLGIALLNTERAAEALGAFERATDCNFMFARAWHGKAGALLKLDRLPEALAACDEALRLEPAEDEFVYTRALIQKGLGRMDEARKTYVQSLARRVVKSPVYAADRRASQKADCLIVNLDPCLEDDFKSFEQLQREAPNYPGQIAVSLADDFHFSLAFKGELLNSETLARIPRPDVVINNHANGEMLVSSGELSAFGEAMDSFGVPVVNHPLKAAQTSRDAQARALANLPGVRVPKTLRFSAEGRTTDQLVRVIESEFQYPLITRTLATQRGIGMEKSDSREDLLKVMGGEMPGKFFVTEFVDSRGGNELFRKVRAAVVGDEIIIVRSDYDAFWNIHGRRSGVRAQYYLDNPHLLEWEKRVCAEPEKELGRAALAALRAIRSRIPLEIFGIDFDVDADGTVVFYEANATMNLLTNYTGKLVNPLEANERLLGEIRRYLASFAAPGR